MALHTFLTLLPRNVSDWNVQWQPKDMEEVIGLAKQSLVTDTMRSVVEMTRKLLHGSTLQHAHQRRRHHHWLIISKHLFLRKLTIFSVYGTVTYM